MNPGFFLILALCSAVFAENIPDLCTDRAAVERVYYNHRLGEKPAFEQALPRDTLLQIIRADLHKEAVLRKAYGVEITPVLIEAEGQRIKSTTRAPEMLGEIKAALGNDPGRFARAVVKPILVERELRRRFENDDKLHAAERRHLESARNELLAAHKAGAAVEHLIALLKRSHSNQVDETTWQLGARPAAAEIIDKERKFYFEDLATKLQQVLRAQLRQAGDVSAVIEMPTGFMLYVAKEKTSQTLTVAALSLPKRSYEEWLAQQRE